MFSSSGCGYSIGARPFFQFPARTTDIDEASDTLAGLGEGGVDLRRISFPSGDPPADIAHCVRGLEQVHPCRTRRELLLPDRNLVVLDGRRDQDDQRLSLPRELVRLLMMRWSRAGIFLLKRAAEQQGEMLALVLADDHEAPGRQLAVIRHTHGNLEHLAQFLVRRSRADHFAGASGSAGLEQRQG